MRCLLLLSLLTFFSCIEKSQKPCDCVETVILNEELKEVQFFSLKFDLPISWECDVMINADSSTSKVCIDTSLLYEEGKIKGISVSEFPFQQKEDLLILERNMKDILNNEELKLLGQGKQILNQKSVNWVSYRDTANFNVTYYLFGERYKLINVSVSIDSLSDISMCSLVQYIESMR